MTKDWNYYRKNFISFNHDNINIVFEKMEQFNMSPIEKIAYTMLVNLQTLYGIYYFSIKPQFKFQLFTLDFYIEVDLPGINKYRFNIECDGHEFHEKTKEQASKDKRRDRELQKAEVVVLRYSGSDIVNNPTVIREDITAIIGIPDWVVKHERNVSNK